MVEDNRRFFAQFGKGPDGEPTFEIEEAKVVSSIDEALEVAARMQEFVKTAQAQGAP